jgi:hypothetical protein
MRTRSLAVAAALLVTVLLAGKADARVHKGVVTKVEPPSLFNPGGATRVLMDSGKEVVEFWITPDTRFYMPLRRILSPGVRKGDRIEVDINREDDAKWVSVR